MHKWVRRPSPAMIVASLALVAATSGNAIADGVTAVAAKINKNAVTSREVKNGSLTLADFKAAERAKLKGDAGKGGATGPTGPAGAKGDAGPAGPQGPAGTPDGYTKAEADGKFLGAAAKSADAEKLDGKDSSQFMGGKGAVSYNKRTLSLGQSGTLLSVDSVGTFDVSCTGTVGAVSADVTFTNKSGRTTEAVENYTINDTADVTSVEHRAIPNNGTWIFPTSVDGLNGIGEFDWNLSSASPLFISGSSAATAHIAALTDTGDDDKCTFWGQYTANSTDPIFFVIGG